MHFRQSFFRIFLLLLVVILGICTFGISCSSPSITTNVLSRRRKTTTETTSLPTPPPPTFPSKSSSSSQNEQQGNIRKNPSSLRKKTVGEKAEEDASDNELTLWIFLGSTSIVALFLVMFWYICSTFYPAIYSPKQGRYYVRERGLYHIRRQDSTPKEDPTGSAGFTSFSSVFKQIFLFQQQQQQQQQQQSTSAPKESSSPSPPTETSTATSRGIEDEKALIKFVRTLSLMFCLLALVVCAILIPYNLNGLGGRSGMLKYSILNRISAVNASGAVVTGNIANNNNNDQPQTIINQTSLADILKNSQSEFWPHVAMSYIVCIAVVFTIYFIHASIAHLRHQYLIRHALNPYSLCGKVLILRDVPIDATPENLYSQFDRIFPDQIVQVKVNSNESREFEVSLQLKAHRNALEKSLVMYLKRLSLVLKREKYPCLLEDEWNTIRRGGGRRGGKGERIARTSDGTTSEVVNLESPQPQPSPSTITNVDDYDGNTSGFIHLASDSLSRSESSFPQSNANNNSTNNTSFPPPPPLLIPSVLTPKILSSLRPRIRPPRKGKDKTIFFLPRTIWVDAIDYHTDQVNILTEMLTNNSYPSPSSSASSSSAPWAFVVFKDLSSAQLAANGVHIRSNPFKACHTVSDIDPSKDLLWENISLKPLSRALRSLLSHGISISVTILWTALNASLLTLLSYDELRKAFPSLPELSELSGSSSDTSTTKNVIRTSIPTIIQIIMLLLLPLLFKRLVRLEGRLSKPEVDISIFRRMSIFLILNFIIFTIVSSTILQSTLNFLNITAMLHDIGESISTSISSFINLLIPLIFIDPAFQMLQLDKLIIVQTVTGLIAKTPRDLFTAVRVTKFEPGRNFARHTMVAVIGISFASIAPLVLIFIAVYFLLRWITYRHLFKHMYVIAHPNGGIMFAVAAKYLLFGVYIHIALMFTFFLTKMAVVPLLIILLLLVAVVIAHMFLKPYEDMVQQLPLQVIASALHKEKSQIATLKNPKHHHQPQQSLSSTSSSVSLFANQQHHHPCTSRKSSSAAAVTLDVTTDISPSCSSSLSADGMNNNVEGNFRHHHPMNSLSSPHPSSSSSSMIANKGLYQDNCLLYPSLQKLLSPYSQNYKDIWIPHDRYDLCSSVITPMLRQRGFLGKIQTDHAFMDIFGRVTVGDTKK